MSVEEKQKKLTPVGQYYLMEKIAQGGMAEIFKGLSYDLHGLKKTVCIKKILSHLSASKEFIDSLIDEAKLAVKLVHGNIAQTFDLGKVGDDYFMVMEYVEGKSLSQINKKCITKGELIPIPFLVYFISEVANGLNYMHRRTDENGNPLHIIHRDISPQNVMVSYSGTVKIIDFGIAKVSFQAGSTDSGVLKGKFAYMSPEQAHGDAIDQRSDIFSLGIILHEMLTGRRLFKADDSRQTIRNVRRAKVEAPSAVRHDIPEELDRISMKALAKDRRRRYHFSSDFSDDLVKFLHANYPDFKPSDAAAFVRELMSDELAKPASMETDAKTPHLIIDRSNSALANDSQFEATGAARAPLNLSEYMLEETREPCDHEIEAPEFSLEACNSSSASEFEEKTAPQWIKKGLGVFRKILAVAAIAAFIILAIVAARKFRPKSGKPAASFAQAIVTAIPGDASVYLNGNFVGQGSPVTIKDITPDEEHEIEIKKEGFSSNVRRVKLSAGEIMGFSAALAPIAPSEASIEIQTIPSGAKIYIDDIETSKTTPATIPGLPHGKELAVGVYMPGHRFWTKKVTLKGGETKSFDINLAKDFGSVSVDSSPQGALVMIDGVPAGQTPLERENLEPDRVYKIEIWHEGYQPFAEEIKTFAGRNEKVKATLAPEPKLPPEKEKPEKAEQKEKPVAPRPPDMIESPVPADTPR